MKYIALIIPIAALICGCSKQITGQVFLSNGGISVPLGGVQVIIVDSKSADDFISRKRAEIDAKIKSLRQADQIAETNYEINVKLESQAGSALDIAKSSRAWIKDKQYASLMDKRTEDEEKLEQLYAARDLIHRQLSRSLTAMDEARINSIDTALNANDEQTSALAYQIREIDIKRQAIIKQFLDPFERANAKYSKDLQSASDNYNAAEMALTNFPVLNEYFNGFSLPAIDSATTDSDGNFTLHKAKSGTKVFAQAHYQDSDFTNSCFWLVNLPQDGNKLILSSGNLFSPPQ